MYHITYSIKSHPEGIEKKNIPHDDGGCHSIVLHSIIHTEGGGLSMQLLSLDGHTQKELPPDELFKVWAGMAYILTQSDHLAEGQRELCQLVHETVKRAVTRAPRMPYQRRSSITGKKTVVIDVQLDYAPCCGTYVTFPGAEHPGIIKAVEMLDERRWHLLVEYAAEDEQTVHACLQGGKINFAQKEQQ